jgi:hypothetical protein
MSASFSVGDVVEIIDSGRVHRHHQLIGTEAVVLAGPCESFLMESRVYYVIAGHDGVEYYADPLCLRKRHPPREQTSTWDDVIVWRPKETAHV